jgi:cyclic-di-GMP phosphodiesterase TipF (flagellum assembly factor)
MSAILDAFEADRLELHLQPVVSLPQRRTRGYEILSRLRLADGTLLVPAEFLPTFERCGIVAELDRQVTGRAGQIARHLKAKGSDAFVTCNLSPRSLGEPEFLRSLARIVDSHADVASRLVLELSQHCWRSLEAEQGDALARLRDKGILFGLDRATDLRFDPIALAGRGVRYLKLPTDLILRGAPERRPDLALSDLSAALDRAGIRFVAERVEREQDVPDLIDLDVPMAQGHVFAPPRAIRAEVLAAPAARPEQAASPQRSAEAAPAPMPAREAVAGREEERLPFRAFLRRAG